MKVDETSLKHYGVKGMKWGVRKSESATPKTGGVTGPKDGKGWRVNNDGSIDIEAGTTLSRVVRNEKGLFGGTGVSLDSGKPIYAAFTPHDVVAYEHFFGRNKSLFTKNASTVLKLSSTTKLRAPGPKEATAIYYDTLKKDPAKLAAWREALPTLSRRSLDQAIEDPGSQKAYELYSRILDGANYNEKGSSVNESYFAAVKKAGYNMLLDPSDAYGGFDAPVMVLDGGKNLKTTSQYIVDKASAEKARLAYKSESAKVGKLYLEKLGYM